MSYFKAKMYKIRFRLGPLGPRHRPCWGSSQRSPYPKLDFRGPISRGREGNGRGGKGREEKEERGNVREVKEGRGRKVATWLLEWWTRLSTTYSIIYRNSFYEMFYYLYDYHEYHWYKYVNLGSKTRWIFADFELTQHILDSSPAEDASWIWKAS